MPELGLTKEEAEKLRQWYTGMLLEMPSYLTVADHRLAVKIHQYLGVAPPTATLTKAL